MNCKKREKTINDVINTAYSFSGCGHYKSIKPVQIRSELTDLSTELADSGINTVVEIGSDDGGTFYTWVRALEPDNAVSIDRSISPRKKFLNVSLTDVK